MKRIILASSSPRRREIFEKMGLEFEIIPSDYEEVWENLAFSYEKVEEMACNKAQAVADKLPDSLVLGADTVVVLDGKILTKPKDDLDAVKMLQSLSGKKHSVVTSICLINSKSGNKKTMSTTSFVEFKKLSHQQIKDYIEKYKPLDKAGAYGIQELPEGFVETIEGSFENIIGLCPQTVEEIFGYFN